MAKNFSEKDIEKLKKELKKEWNHIIQRENIKLLEENNKSFFSDSLGNSGLNLKIPKEKAYGIFSTLLFTATMEKYFGYNKYEVFEFSLDSSITQIFYIN